MARRKKKRQNVGDVTIRDCADAQKLTNRLPKVITSSSGFGLVNEAPSITMGMDLGMDDEFEEWKSKSQAKPDQDQGNEPYRKLPYDFWELISRFIDPEDILRFSLICRDAYSVVNKVSFWRHLHNHYCLGGRQLFSSELKYIPQLKLKLTVIRKLFDFYPTFQMRRTSSKWKDPHLVKNYLCLDVRQTRQVDGKGWRIQFLLQKWRPNLRSCSRGKCNENGARSLPNDWTELCETEDDPADVSSAFYNPDYGQFLLLISSRSFTSMCPNLLGMKLGNVNLSISVGQTLQLRFVPAHQNSCDCIEAVNIVINEVRDMTVVPWFTSQFVHVLQTVPTSFRGPFVTV